MLAGPLWGLSHSQDRHGHFKILLCIMRIPGLFLMDIWWQSYSSQVIPLSLDHRAIAESGYNMIPFLVATAVLLLPLQELVNFYMHAIAAGALVRSVFSAWSFPQEELKIKNELGPGEMLFDFG